jgi:hypothetical protein
LADYAKIILSAPLEIAEYFVLQNTILPSSDEEGNKGRS